MVTDPMQELPLPSTAEGAHPRLRIWWIVAAVLCAGTAGAIGALPFLAVESAENRSGAVLYLALGLGLLLAASVAAVVPFVRRRRLRSPSKGKRT